MSGLITETFGSFSEVIKGLSMGIKDSFRYLIYVDPTAADPQFSPIVLFVFTMAGMGLATGILYKIFGMIRARKG